MKRLVRLLAVVGMLIGLAVPALAHPLGNFTTNVHLGLTVDGTTSDVLLVVDMAEIPTFREDVGADLDAYAAERCAAHESDIDLTADGSRVRLEDRSAAAMFSDGEGGLRTLRLECRWTATFGAGASHVDVRNDVHVDRSGWAEVVVAGASSDVTAVSETDVLRSYPDRAPDAVRDARVTLGAQPVGDGTDRASGATGITAVIAGGLTRAGSTGGVVAVMAALALGVTHALAPGHGKTLMAAYLVGRDGTTRQAAGLGLAVAVSHTIGVGALGVVTAVASSRFRPESVYPWLTTGSAAIVTGLGVVLLVRAFRGRAHHHHHHHDHDHDHDHDDHHHHEPPRDLGWRSLAALGLAGGLVPSASAVVLLLGAVAIGRPWFGVALVLAFGVGMSIALVGAGLVALRLTSAGLRHIERRIRLPRRLVPAVAGAAVTTVGALLLWSSAPALL